MNFVWSNNDIASQIITISETNITLNKAACSHFEDVNYVLLGIDINNKQIGIKPVTSECLEQNLYPKNQLHRISLGKSYGRITSKSFIQDLIKAFQFNFDEHQSYKYTGTFDVIHQIFIVKVKEV